MVLASKTLNYTMTGDGTAVSNELKSSINTYMKDLEVSPVRTFAALTKFNYKFSDLTCTKSICTQVFLF